MEEGQKGLEGRLRGGHGPEEAQRGCVGLKRVENRAEREHGAPWLLCGLWLFRGSHCPPPRMCSDIWTG